MKEHLKRSAIMPWKLRKNPNDPMWGPKPPRTPKPPRPPRPPKPPKPPRPPKPPAPPEYQYYWVE